MGATLFKGFPQLIGTEVAIDVGEWGGPAFQSHLQLTIPQPSRKGTTPSQLHRLVGRGQAPSAVMKQSDGDGMSNLRKAVR